MTAPQATGVSPRIVSSFPASAVAPPEWRGIGRDEVRLLVSDDAGHHHARFIDLPDFLVPGDLLVVNESAGVRATSGLTRLFVEPARGTVVVDGLITGLHEPGTSHRALLEAVGGATRVRHAYEEAIAGDYLRHEFGDVHLLWKQ